jgi:hypothetical protein
MEGGGFHGAVISGPTQADRQPSIGGCEAVAIVLITLDALLQAIEGLIPGGQSPEVVEGPVCAVLVLRLQAEDLVLEASILGAE